MDPLPSGKISQTCNVDLLYDLPIEVNGEAVTEIWQNIFVANIVGKPYGVVFVLINIQSHPKGSGKIWLFCSKERSLRLDPRRGKERLIEQGKTKAIRSTCA